MFEVDRKCLEWQKYSHMQWGHITILHSIYQFDKPYNLEVRD